MAIDLKEIVRTWDIVRNAGDAISGLAADIDHAKTADGTDYDSVTLSTMRTKVPALKTAYSTAASNFVAAMTP